MFRRQKIDVPQNKKFKCNGGIKVYNKDPLTWCLNKDLRFMAHYLLVAETAMNM